MWLGDFPVGFTTVPCTFTTHASTGAPVAPLTAFEIADVKVFKNGSATERTSASGMTMTSPFNGSTGLHTVLIDLSDNTDAGFWSQGSTYTILLEPSDETVDGVAVLKVIGQFSIDMFALADLSDAVGTLPADITFDIWTADLATYSGTAGSTAEALDAAAAGGGPTAADIADAVWDEDATGHQTQGSFGQAIGDPAADTDTIWGLVNTNLNATVSSRATQTSVDTVDDFLDLELPALTTAVGAIKTKTDFLPSATAGAAGGVFIAGTNAATVVTTSFTTTFTGNLTGSVGSVTGAVGSVTGAVGSVTGAVGSVTGAVGSISAGGITAASFAANAITAAKLDPDVTTELQAGLATSSSITTLQTSVDDLPTNAELATALGTADDAVLTQVALVKAKTDLIPGTQDGKTFAETVLLMSSVLLGKASGMETGTGAFRSMDDTIDRVTATFDVDGNRTAVTYDTSSP